MDMPVLYACERHDVESVAVFGSREWDRGGIFPERTRRVLVDRQTDIDSVLSALAREGLANHRYSGVQTSDEMAVVLSGALGRSLGVRSIDPLTATNFRDKARQKEKVGAAGVPTARHAVITDICDLESLAYPFDGPAVLKPVAGAGTGDTQVITGLAELKEIGRRCRDSRTEERAYVLEEFMEGDEWLADGVVFDGELLFFAVARYDRPCLSTVEQRLPLSYRRFDPQTDAWAYELAGGVVRGALKALELDHGVFHMEMFHDTRTGVLSFGECGARRGGVLVQEDVLFKFGVDLAECAMLCAIGERPDIRPDVRPEAVGCTYLGGEAGVVLRTPSHAEILARPNVEFARIHHPRGFRLPEMNGISIPRIGMGMVTGATAEDVERHLAELCDWFADELVIAPVDVTLSTLRQWHRSRWPEPGFGEDIRYER